MQWLAEVCVKRPVFATMIVMSLVVVGAYPFFSPGVDLFPKVDFPTVTITVLNPGSSPQEIETEITEKIEEAVNTISGIDELRSSSIEMRLGSLWHLCSKRMSILRLRKWKIVFRP